MMSVENFWSGHFKERPEGASACGSSQRCGYGRLSGLKEKKQRRTSAFNIGQVEVEVEVEVVLLPVRGVNILKRVVQVQSLPPPHLN